MKILLSILIIILLASCNFKQRENCYIEGKTNNLKDGLKLYLIEPLSSKKVDSTIVKNNSFSFEISIYNSPSLYVLANNSEFKYIWLEKNLMTFDASDTNFNNAKIKGSKTQEVYQKLEYTKKDLSEKGKQKVDIEFIKENPDNYISSFLLWLNMNKIGKDFTTKLYNELSLENKSSVFGKIVQGYLKLNKEVKIGDHFIDFEMKDINGNPQRLSNYKGKVILLEFWASWCGPCRQENPSLLKTYGEFHNKGFEIFAISLDNVQDEWLKAVKEDRLKWIHVSDLKGASNDAALIYGIHSVPTNLLIDKSGIVIAENLNSNELNRKLIGIFEFDRVSNLNIISFNFFKKLKTSKPEEIKTYFSPSTSKKLTANLIQSIIDKISSERELKLISNEVTSGNDETSYIKLKYESLTGNSYINLVFDKNNKIQNLYFEDIK